ncbi:TcaA second domain-containing protein [Listeria costaricensis]|uniref:TcaA second domain-containing protein n=1 Tax=Listeria costaricensis TaxID=2026604 RepID=UPI000C072B1A|nr:hypothetical protein [Listeria costaricensis]
MKHKKWWLIAAGVVVVLGIFFIWGAVTHSRSTYYEAFKQALDDKNAKEMTQLLTTSDTALKIDEAGCQAFIDYLTNNPEDRTQFLKNLKKETEADQTIYSNEFPYTLVKDGHDMLFFPHYALSIKPMYFTVTTDADKVSLSANKKEIPYLKKTDRYGPLMPGEYDVDATLACSIDVPIVHEKNQQLVRENQNLDLQVGDVLAEDKSFQKDLGNTADKCMTEYAQFMGGGLDETKLVTGTDDYRETSAEGKELILPFVTKIDMAYQEIQINNDSIKVEKKLDDWEASMDANIKMQGNIAFSVEDQSASSELEINGVHELIFIYDTKQDKWLLDSAEETYSDTSGGDNINKIAHENPQNYEWTNNGEADF